MAGFGDLMSPGGKPVEEASASSWSDLVKDPIARSTLLSFGLQAMSGGWGNGTQQLAAALGAGATAGAATSEAMQKQMEADDKAAESSANSAANRATQLEIAKLNADNRREVAGIRTEALLERTRMNLSGKASANDAIKYRAEARKIVEGNPRNMGLSQPEREAMIEDLAARMYDTDAARRPGASTANSPKTPGAPVVPGPGQSPGQTPGQKPSAQNSDPTASQALKNPAILEKLGTPEGQAELRRINPAAAERLIRQYELMNQGLGGLESGM